MNTVEQLEEALRAQIRTHQLAIDGANAEIAQLRRDKAALNACIEKYERVMAQLRKERDVLADQLREYARKPEFEGTSTAELMTRAADAIDAAADDKSAAQPKLDL